MAHKVRLPWFTKNNKEARGYHCAVRFKKQESRVEDYADTA